MLEDLRSFDSTVLKPVSTLDDSDEGQHLAQLPVTDSASPGKLLTQHQFPVTL